MCGLGKSLCCSFGRPPNGLDPCESLLQIRSKYTRPPGLSNDNARNACLWSRSFRFRLFFFFQASSRYLSAPGQRPIGGHRNGVRSEPPHCLFGALHPYLTRGCWPTDVGPRVARLACNFHFDRSRSCRLFSVAELGYNCVSARPFYIN
jgi:hypothetical protein